MHKPTALITASGLGEKGHESLLLILKTIEAKIGEHAALLISGARTKVSPRRNISDVATVDAINLLIEFFIKTINE